MLQCGGVIGQMPVLLHPCPVVGVVAGEDMAESARVGIAGQGFVVRRHLKLRGDVVGVVFTHWCGPVVVDTSGNLYK